MAIIAIDLDGTIVNKDKPLEGAREAINLLREHGHKVVINSCNRLEWIIKVLDNNDIRYDAVYGEGSAKPVADLYVDDRGYRFKGDWVNEVNDILALVGESR